jgi:hypothetical protein
VADVGEDNARQRCWGHQPAASHGRSIPVRL